MLQNRLIYSKLSWWHHFKGSTLPFQLFSQVFIHSQSLCFSKIITHRLKSTMETLSLTSLENSLIDRQCWVSQDASDVLYLNGLNTPTQMVLQVDALPKHWVVNKFWRFGKLSCKIMPPHHCYLVSYLSIDLCSAVPCKIFAQIFIYATAITWLLILTSFFCASGSTYLFQSSGQLNRNDLIKGKLVKADANARNIYMRTGWMDINSSSSYLWWTPDINQRYSQKLRWPLYHFLSVLSGKEINDWVRFPFKINLQVLFWHSYAQSSFC